MKNEHQAMAAYFKASKLMRGSVTDTFRWENVPKAFLWRTSSFSIHSFCMHCPKFSLKL